MFNRKTNEHFTAGRTDVCQQEEQTFHSKMDDRFTAGRRNLLHQAVRIFYSRMNEQFYSRADGKVLTIERADTSAKARKDRFLQVAVETECLYWARRTWRSDSLTERDFSQMYLLHVMSARLICKVYIHWIRFSALNYLRYTICLVC